MRRTLVVALLLAVAGIGAGVARERHRARVERAALERVRLVAFGRPTQTCIRQASHFLEERGLRLEVRAPSTDDPLYRELVERYDRRAPIIVIGGAFLSSYDLDADSCDSGDLAQVLAAEHAMELHGRKRAQLCRWFDCPSMTGPGANLPRAQRPVHELVLSAFALALAIGAAIFLAADLGGKRAAAVIGALVVLTIPAFGFPHEVVGYLGQAALVLFGLACLIVRRARRAGAAR